MAALTIKAERKEFRGTFKDSTLASGNKAFQGGSIFLNPATNKVVSGANVAAVGLQFLGFSTQDVDATLADKSVQVNLIEEETWIWWDNATSTDAIAATDLGKMAYALDDHTASILATGKSPLGRIRAVDTIKGVAIEKVRPGTPSLAANPTPPAFASNDCIPTDIINGAVYLVPLTGAASTVTLPAAAADGTVAYWVADGTLNGHTVQYRDATGPTNLTTALTASKRHLVVVAKNAGKWTANAYVSP